jgi:ubiquinone/menaquinone biosynthesis C-methylase UbiE
MNAEGHTHSHAGTAPATEGRTIGWARHYDLAVRLLTLGKEQGLRDQTIRQAAIPSGATALDVGCGTGTLTLLAKTQTGDQGKVYGIDAAPEMIEVAQHKAVQQKRDVDFQTGVIEALPFPDDMFDVVLSSLMFHHLPDDLKKRGLSEIYRVLKPGGRLLIVDMRRPSNVVQHISMAFMFHGGITSGIQDLSPVMKEIGYTNIQLSNVQRSLLGFLQGQRAA